MYMYMYMYSSRVSFRGGHGWAFAPPSSVNAPPSSVNAPPPNRLTILKHVYRHAIFASPPPPQCFVSFELAPLANFLNETLSRCIPFQPITIHALRYMYMYIGIGYNDNC